MLIGCHQCSQGRKGSKGGVGKGSCCFKWRASKGQTWDNGCQSESKIISNLVVP